MEKENEKKNSKVLVAIICILMLLIAVAGSYAYYVAQIEGTRDNSVTITTKSLGIQYNDGANVSFTGALPGLTIIKTVTVSNTGNKAMTYDLSLIDVVNELTATSDLTYSIAASSNDANSNIAAVNSTTFPTAAATLYNDVTINPNEVQTFTITIAYANHSYDQGDDMDKTVSGTLNITDVKEVSA